MISPKKENPRPRNTDVFNLPVFAKANKAVKKGPVFASRVAFAIEVFLTPQKKQVKCKPKKRPAKPVKNKFSFDKDVFFLVILYPQRIPLAANILQKAKVKAGTSKRCRITKDVELTDNRAKPSIKESRTDKLLLKIC